VELYLHFPNTPSWRGAQLKKAQGQLYLFTCLEDRSNINLSWSQDHVVRALRGAALVTPHTPSDRTCTETKTILVNMCVRTVGIYKRIRLIVLICRHICPLLCKELTPLSGILQDIPRLLWNPKVHYSVLNSPPLVPILSQIHPVHTYPPYFPKIYFNIILPSMPMSSVWSLSVRFCDQNCLYIFHLMRATCLAHLILPLSKLKEIN